MNLYSLKLFLSKPWVLYLLSIALGVVGGLYGTPMIQQVGALIADLFIRLFRCLSGPIIALSLIVTLSSFIGHNKSIIWKKTIFYTLSTTIVAALTAMFLYLLIRPENTKQITDVAAHLAHGQPTSYVNHLINLVPQSFLSPFLENQIMGILFIGVLVGIAIPLIPDQKARETLTHFFKGLHGLVFVFTRWLITILPIGIFGFIVVSINQYQKQPLQFQGIGQYFSIILLANFIQGLIILPLWLKWKGIKPYHTMKKMMPALSVAFFSKSSAGTLPLTMTTAETNLGLHPTIARFVLPLCTTVNMNGCAAFIFTTVIFIMQNNGIPITMSNMFAWIFIATIAAVGNAGVPMGCFFLSMSLLASMNIPIVLMGLILPFYNMIDMIETALNVWSDSCVATVIHHEQGESVEDLVNGEVII